VHPSNGSQQSAHYPEPQGSPATPELLEKSKMRNLRLLPLLLALSARAATEVEPNDTAATANPIVPEDPMTGQLASASDQDWFGFTTAGPTTLTVTFTSPFSSNYFGGYLYYTVQVRNAAGTILANLNTSNDATFQTGLASAGTYYLVVVEGPTGVLDTRQYTAAIATAAGIAGVESEPNDTPATADPLTLSQKTAGQVSSQTNQDWYSFGAGTGGVVTVTFTSPFSSNYFGGYLYYTIQVRNIAGTIFANVNTSNDTTFQTGLPSAGTYYVVVSEGPSGLLETRHYWIKATMTPAPTPTILQAQIYPQWRSHGTPPQAKHIRSSGPRVSQPHLGSPFPAISPERATR